MKISGMLFLCASLLVASGCGQGESVASPGSDAVVTAHPGEEIYQNYCFSCHASGLSGAPKLGDAEAWAPLLAKGPQLLLQSTIEGVPPAMPARGMCFDCTDEQLAAAIDYMAKQVE